MLHPARYAQMATELAEKIGGDDSLQEVKGELLGLADEFLELSSQESKLALRMATFINLAFPDDALAITDEMYEQRSYGR